MKLRAHNPNAPTQPNDQDQIKNNKILPQHCIYKSRIPILKENIPPLHQHPPAKKKQIKTKPDAKDTTYNQLLHKLEKDNDPINQYQKQIIMFIKSKEQNLKLTANYLRNHKHLTHQVRAGFIKYFFKIAKKFQLKRSTIYLTVYFMDNFFQKNPDIEKKLAVVIAQTSLFIAMKYQEIYPPQLYQWTQNTKQMVMAQALLLKSLDFNLSYTSIENFFQYYFTKLDISSHDKQFIQLIADISLFDQTMYGYLPSQLSIAIIYSIINRNKLDQKIQMSLKWMIERNQKYMEWLQILKATKKNKY